MSADTKPHIPRRERRRIRRPKPGTVRQLQAVMWRAVLYLEAHLDDMAEADSIDTADLTRVTHALAQTAGTYLKAVEVGELESGLNELQKEFHELRATLSRPANADSSSSAAPLN